MNTNNCVRPFLRILALSLLLLLLLSAAACKSPTGTDEGSSMGESDGASEPAGSDAATTNEAYGDESGGLGDTEPWSDTEGETLLPEPTEVLFDFSYSLDGMAMRGGQVDLNVTLTNAGITYVYEGASSGLRAAAVIYCTKEDGTRYELSCEPVADTDDRAVIEFLYGDSRSFTYCGYRVPEDAPRGRYDLEVSFEESRQVFEGIFTLE